jgi:endonuclease/exonuclease/phosphatase (EEP) superfamily protein YafD
MKTLASLLIIQWLLASIAHGDSLRIATYNVNWGNRRGDQLLDAIAAADADVVCFQETTRQSETFLRERLADTYPFFHSTGHDGRYGAERFAFASKLKLSEVSYVPPDAGLFGFYCAQLQFDGDTIHIVNVHLSPFLIRRGSGLRDAMAAFSATEKRHAAEIGAIVEVIDGRKPTIVVGDFNSPPGFGAPRRLKELGLIDAYASVHEDADAHATWHWRTRLTTIALRIDFIFHTSHFVTTEASIIRREGSDHSLVVAELKRGEQLRPPESPIRSE